MQLRVLSATVPMSREEYADMRVIHNVTPTEIDEEISTGKIAAIK